MHHHTLSGPANHFTPHTTRPGTQLMLALVAGVLTLGPSACTTHKQSSAATDTTTSSATPSAKKPLKVPAAGWTAVIDGKEVPAPAIPMGDDATLLRILEEGRDRNQVMNHITYLTQKIGPRLTGSSRALTANKWSEALFKSWGLDNVHLEQWGTIGVGFDRGPSTARIVKAAKPAEEGGEITYTTLRDMEFSWPSWSRGTNGPVRGKVVREPKTTEEYDRLKADGMLAGAWILLNAALPDDRRGVRNPVGNSFDQRADARKKVAEGADPSTLSIQQRLAFDNVAGFISTTRDERVWTNRINPAWRELTIDTVAPETHVVVRLSDYDYLNSRLADGEDVEVEIDAKYALVPGPVPVYNTVAEIRGSRFPEEIVIVCGHMDSWDGPGSQGTVDNGTGTSVTLEAARILKAAKARPDRTIRFVLWTGEEQGLLGSKRHAEINAADLPRISAVLNDDGGTNYEGGMPAASVMIPYLAAATAPVNNIFYSEIDKAFLNVNIRDTKTHIETHGSSDHAAFNRVGVPGFFWDESGRADYRYAWHTQNDKLDQAISEYLIQSSTNAAVTAYRLACAPSLLPRIGPPGHPQNEAPKEEEPTSAVTESSTQPAAPVPTH